MRTAKGYALGKLACSSGSNPEGPSGFEKVGAAEEFMGLGALMPVLATLTDTPLFRLWSI